MRETPSAGWPARALDDFPRGDTLRAPPVLIFACGNPSRGDDALGPAFLDAIRDGHQPDPGQAPGSIELLAEFQLQVEHALDLAGRRQIVFVDAGAGTLAPFGWREVRPGRDSSFTSHALSPEALLQAFVDVFGESPPPACVLVIRGYEFELGHALSPKAKHNLGMAIDFFSKWLAGITAAPCPGRPSSA